MKNPFPRALALGGALGLAALLSGCSPVALVNGLVQRGGFELSADLAYGPAPAQKLDLYRPVGASGAPVLVFVHGGYWDSGDKADYPFLAETFTARGFVTVIVNYRLAPGTVFPGFVEDAARAVSWVKNQVGRFGGDPARLYLMGHSAGAHIAALVTLDPRYLGEFGLDRSAVRATVGLSGPYDFLPFSPDDARTRRAMGPRQGWPDTQPINLVDGREPPMLLVQGRRDTTVDPGNASRLAERIAARGGRVEVRFYDRLDHIGTVGALARLGRFLEPGELEDVLGFLGSH